MQATPRYFPGRRVLVRAAVDPAVDSPHFMRLRQRPPLPPVPNPNSSSGGGGDEKKKEKKKNATTPPSPTEVCYSTFNATIAAIDAERDVVTVSVAMVGANPCDDDAVDDGGGDALCSMEIPMSEILRLNHPHVLPSLPGRPHEVRLEDSLRCNYRSPLMRAKQCEVGWLVGWLVGW